MTENRQTVPQQRHLHHDYPSNSSARALPIEQWKNFRSDDAGSRTTVWKPLFDRGVALIVLVLLAPLFGLVALLIRLQDPGPVFFQHRRIGCGGMHFGCYKFRTMAVNGDAILTRHLENDPAAAREWAETRKLRNDPRVTPLGNALRRSSLDELPQLINVLRGEMSLVGPRPIVDAEVPRYGEAIEDYLSVRPGMTGPWQVSGRSDTGYRQRVQLDREYACSHSLLGDMAIIARTVQVVLTQRGSY